MSYWEGAEGIEKDLGSWLGSHHFGMGCVSHMFGKEEMAWLSFAGRQQGLGRQSSGTC